MLTEEVKRAYAARGYCRVTGVVPADVLEPILVNLLHVLWRFVPISRDFKPEDRPWERDEFHRMLAELRQSDPGLFSAVYDSVQSSVALKRLISAPEPIRVVSELLGVAPGELSTCGETVRMDPPHDSRNSYGWHQERSYYPMSRRGEGVVCWMPLLDTPIEAGAPEFCPGSHKELFNRVRRSDIVAGGSEQYLVPPEKVEAYTPESVDTSIGDVVLAHMLVYHRSGENVSRRFRFVGIARYQVATSDDFLPFRSVGNYNRHIVERFHEDGDLLEDL